VCCKNAGLYIKLGQQIATMNHVLPAPYLKYFSQLNDQAPSVDYATVSQIVSEEFGVASPDQVFDDFETTPIASASIAQVHRARMKDGRNVAVKVQKPEVLMPSIAVPATSWLKRPGTLIHHHAAVLCVFPAAGVISFHARPATTLCSSV
jgi:hypothetical protein